jgi:dihydroorotate dehydrogenase
MATSIDISVDFAGVRLVSPVFTASGTCGYADELADYMDVGVLGGFIAKRARRDDFEGDVRCGAQAAR